MKRVRMLLRVSSNQQLEADGDLSIQRQIVMEYIDSQEGWLLDEKEYFEGSNSGYKNALAKRETLQEALEDACNHEYDILAVYKDDRVGRRMWEMGAYIMALKSYGVDTYTVKDGLISPETDDIMGQMMLALRYGNAQKSSSDTGMRVKDTAQKLVRKGKFMGGRAPYGYELVLSGELSKHGRALHMLKIIPEQAEVVKHIYTLSVNKEYGSVKIARELNRDAYYRYLAPRDVWKEGTITSILTNPVYAGYVAYKRRERINGSCHRLDQEEWIRAETVNEDIKMIEEEMWNLVQEKRKKRSTQYGKERENQHVHRIPRKVGSLSLIDVAYCGYCGEKLVNGSRYNYWRIKNTGERRSSKTLMYRCKNAGHVPLHPIKRFSAGRMEKAVFSCIVEYASRILEDVDVYGIIQGKWKMLQKTREAALRKEREELGKLQKGLEVMESHIPEAMEGEYLLSIKELAEAIRRQQKKEEEQKTKIREKEEQIKEKEMTKEKWEEMKKRIPTWQQIFWEMDPDTRRVLIQKLVERILVTQEQIVIRFKFRRSDLMRESEKDG